MRLAEQRGAVASAFGEVGGDTRRVVRQLDTVGEDTVRAHVLAREHGRPRRHAHRVLVVRAAVVDTLGGKAVGDGRARDRVAVAAQRVIALLDLAAHGNLPFAPTSPWTQQLTDRRAA